jgi:aryl-alcohol dehydrogenase-like predicted oxidoreductase
MPFWCLVLVLVLSRGSHAYSYALLPSTSIHSTQRQRQIRRHSPPRPTMLNMKSPAIPSPPPPDKSKSKRPAEFVDFWGTQQRRGDDDDAIDEETALPCVRNLDRQYGPLPSPGAYLLQGDPELVDAKRACRLSLGVQLDEKAEAEPEQVLRELQQCIDAGFQTFQLHPNNNNHNNNNNNNQNNNDDQLKWIAKLRQAMPRYVETHWTLRFEMPTVDTSTTTVLTPTSIRQQVVDLLDRTKSDAIDTLLVQHSSSLQHAPYHLDVLDTLMDLQRQGYIRSIGVENWPSALIRQAQRCGLTTNINVHQHSGSLLLPPPATAADTTSTSTVGLAQQQEWWTNPLMCGDFLSEAYLDRRGPPTKEVQGWQQIQTWNTLKRGAGRVSEHDKEYSINVWRRFQKDVLEPLQYMSRKHQVPMSAIALRWAMQQPQRQRQKQQQQQRQGLKGTTTTTSTVVPFRVGRDQPETILPQQLRGFRDVFRFELDEEDFEQLERTVIARAKPKKTTLRIDDVEVPLEDIPLEFLKAYVEPQDGDDYGDGDDKEYPVIDFGNKSLWL